MSGAQEPARARAQSSHEFRLAPIPEDFVPDAVTGDSYNDKDEDEATSEDHAATAAIPFLTAMRSPMDARGRSRSAPSTFGTFERAQDANWFATATPTSFFGFPPVTQQLAMNNTPEATRSFPDNESTTATPWHSKVFEDAYRPLLPGENLFEVVDPVKERRRFANYIYGFIPNPGTEGRAAPSWNEEQEQMSGPPMRDQGAFESRPYGNSLGGGNRGRRRRRDRGATRGRGQGNFGAGPGSRPRDDAAGAPPRGPLPFEISHPNYHGRPAKTPTYSAQQPHTTQPYNFGPYAKYHAYAPSANYKPGWQPLPHRHGLGDGRHEGGWGQMY